MSILTDVAMLANALHEETAVREVWVATLVAFDAGAGLGELEAEPLVPCWGRLVSASVATGWSSGGRVACAT